MGAAIDGFPNMFIIFGPNTATGHSSVIMASENMIKYTLQFMKPILKGDVAQYEVKREAEEAYTQDIQKKLKKTVWMNGGCHSWYKTADGWNSTLYPYVVLQPDSVSDVSTLTWRSLCRYSQTWFAIKCMFPKWDDWNVKYTPKGRRKQRLRKLGTTVLIILVLAGLLNAVRAGYGLADGPGLIRHHLRRSLGRVVRSAIWGLESVQKRLQI
jgi:hypothetical protein